MSFMRTRQFTWYVSVIHGSLHFPPSSNFAEAYYLKNNCVENDPFLLLRSTNKNGYHQHKQK